jgi:hypothetical protein
MAWAVEFEAAPAFTEPNPGVYTPDDLIKSICANVLAGPERDMSTVPMVSQHGHRCYLIDDLAEYTKMFEDYFKIDMKVSRQFISPQNVKDDVVGPGTRQINCTRSPRLRLRVSLPSCRLDLHRLLK